MLTRPARSARRSTAGLTLIEMLVVLGIVAIIAAVVIPNVAPRVAASREAALAQTLDALSDAVLEYRADVRRYPTHLRWLSSAPGVGVQDLCGQTVPADYRGEWRGPYLKENVLTTGIPVGDALVRDSLELDPAGPYTVDSNGALVIVVENVDASIASRLEEKFDGDGGTTTGTVRFTAGAAGQGTLRFAVPVRGC